MYGFRRIQGSCSFNNILSDASFQKVFFLVSISTFDIILLLSTLSKCRKCRRTLLPGLFTVSSVCLWSDGFDLLPAFEMLPSNRDILNPFNRKHLMSNQKVSSKWKTSKFFQHIYKQIKNNKNTYVFYWSLRICTPTCWINKNKNDLASIWITPHKLWRNHIVPLMTQTHWPTCWWSLAPCFIASPWQ